MTRKWAWLTGLIIATVGVIAVTAWADDEEEEGKKVPLDQIPAAVKATIQAEGGQIEDIERQTSDGKTIYEADVVKDGKEIELRIAEDGKLISRKVEGDAKGKEKDAEDDEGDDEDEHEEEGHSAQKRAADENEGDDEDEKDEEKETGKKPTAGMSEAQWEARAAAAGTKALALAKITMIEAIATALKQAPDAKAYQAILKTEDGQPRYEVMIVAGDKILEVALDGVTGKVLEVEPKGSTQAQGDTRPFRDGFKVDKANLGPTGKNPYWNLEPGYRLHYAGGKETLIISILDETKVVDGVTTRVVEERESKNGQLVEVSRNFFAIDKTTQDIYYFGEEVDIYKNGKVVKHEGAWLAGEKQARFGLMMPGKVMAGDRFYQEIAPKEALDRAEVTSTDEKITTPAGTFEHCVHMRETSPLEPDDVSHKVWAPGVGLVKDDSLLLVKIEKPGQ